jgi:hypothetical protein
MTAVLDLTVIMPTIPEREALRAEAVASLQAQEDVEFLFLMGEDTHYNGPIETVNALANCVTTDWLFRLDDDDLVDPDHFKTLSHWLTDDADIVYSWCRIEGGGDDHPPDQFQVRLQNDPEYGWDYLRTANWIPASACIRTDLWWELGGYQKSTWTEHEDHDLWVRALDAGARFKCVPAVTWTYRMNSEWNHLGAERDACAG